MEGVNASRLPVIGAGLQVGGIRASRVPGTKSWARIRTCLIDNPKDDEFNRRQEVWSFHNRNRGVVKSLLKTLPNVPFRIKKKMMRDRDIETERDKIRQTISKLPNLSNSDNFFGGDFPGKNARTRPLGMSKHCEFNFRSNERNKLNEDFDSGELLQIDDNNNQNDSELIPVNQQLPRLKERTSRTSPNKGSSKLDDHAKKVSFSMNDLSTEIDNRCPTAFSTSSSVLETAIANYGHTSHGIADITPRSVLDIFGNNGIGDSKNVETSERKHVNSLFTVSDTHKNWFQRVVGEKELIAANEYENFARTSRPYYERAMEESQPTGKIPPEKQYSKSGWNVYSQSIFTGNKQYNSGGLDKYDNKLSKLSSTKVGSRSVESRLYDQNNAKINDAEKLKRVERTFQAQAQTQNRISERILQGMSPDRNGRSPERTTPAQTQTPNRLADRLALSRSPDRQNQVNNRNITQRQGKSNRMEQSTENNISPNASPSPTRFMGEYKLSKSPLPTSPSRYFPIFPTDGTPMRKIGGGKNKISKTNSRNQQIVFPLQEAETYVMS